MQSVISDTLVQDPLNKQLPIYPLDIGKKVCYINKEYKIETFIVNQDKQFTVPLLDLGGDWKMSWRREPVVMKTALENLLIYTATLSANCIKFNNLKDTLDSINGIINFLISKEYKCSNGRFGKILCSLNFKMKNNKELSELNIDRSCIIIPQLSDDKIIVLPDPEFVGALPLAENKLFGAFAVPDNIINVDL